MLRVAGRAPRTTAAGVEGQRREPARRSDNLLAVDLPDLLGERLERGLRLAKGAPARQQRALARLRAQPSPPSLHEAQL